MRTYNRSIIYVTPPQNIWTYQEDIYMFISWPVTKVTWHLQICHYFLHVSVLHTSQSYSVLFYKGFGSCMILILGIGQQKTAIWGRPILSWLGYGLNWPAPDFPPTTCSPRQPITGEIYSGKLQSRTVIGRWLFVFCFNCTARNKLMERLL